MAQLKFGSAGVTANEIDLSGPVAQQPVGVPAGIIGTATRGPAFVPITVGVVSDFYAKFGKTDGKKFGPLAATEWLKKAQALTYVRVLGVGDGKQRNNDGSVTSAGFTVGEEQPRSSDGALSANSYANGGSNSVLGRTYFLGAFMSESAGSTVFSEAGLQGTGSYNLNTSVPIVRGVVMAPSGVILRMSSSVSASAAPASTLVATDQSAQGAHFGTVVLLDGTTSKSDFVMLLNGHKGTDPLYPNVITASFDMTAPNYFANVFNVDPYKLEQAGHYLYAHWDVHPCLAVVTGSGLIHVASGAGASTTAAAGKETAAFLATGSLSRNTGDSTAPNFEAFTDRFSSARSPWIISQRFGGVASDLFRFHALDAGTGVSTNYKISIENIVPSTDPLYLYGSFDVVIRDWNDNDTSQVQLEAWRGVNLDPESDRYIAKVIGDAHVFFNFDQAESSQKIVVDGNYQNNSNYVRIEVASSVDNQTLDPAALPLGVRGPMHLVTTGSVPLTSAPTLSQVVSSDTMQRAVQPPLSLRKNITQGSGTKLSVNPLLYWGPRFEHVTSLTTPNASTLQDDSMRAFATFFPEYSETTQTMMVGDNTGAVFTNTNGELDVDKFCRNIFTLENIKLVTGSTGLADSSKWEQATYVRNGNIVANDTAKTRAMTVDDLVQANRRYLKFNVLMQGGFDGVNIFNQDEDEINNTAVVADMNDTDRGLQNGPSVKAYNKAVDIMKSTTDVDIQLLAIPGIRHPIVTDYAISAVQDRFDAMFVMDIEQVDTNNDNVTLDSQLPSVTYTVDVIRDRALDSSFAAAYFPDVLMQDPNTLSNVIVPPSVVVMGALALNDAVGHPWFAPAGFTRGALPSTLEARVKLSKSNMDALYDVNVNPIVAFPATAVPGLNPSGGVVVWGQRTLQAAASALDRVNVRRLLIDIRRQVREITQTIMFEQNREATLARFTDAVEPRLKKIQAQSGLERYKVSIDSSTTTQADIDNNTIRGKIIVQPTKTIEFVSLDFVASNNQTP